MSNQQANEAGTRADEIIKQLANPSDDIVTDKATVKVIDQATPAPAANPQNHNWEERFNKYKASSDSTIHALRKQAQQFDMLKAENESLKQTLTKVEDQLPKTPNGLTELFSDEEIDGVQKMVSGEVDELKATVEQLKAQQTRARDAELQAESQKVHVAIVNAVKQSVPEYESIDKDPGFSKWMQEPDEFGNIRYDLLVTAKATTPPDIGRIVQFYRDYSGVPRQQQEVQVAQPKVRTPRYTQQELLQQPSSHTGASAPQQEGLGIAWTTATASQFYKDKALGKINPEDAQLLEADLYRAMGHR